MALDLIELAWKILPPAATGVAGAAGSVWQITKELAERVKVLELNRLPLVETWVSTFRDTKYPEDINALKKLVDDLKQELNDELDKLYNELRGRGKERREERRLQSRLTENYLSLQTRLTACETAITRLNEAFTQHAKGQQEQWQEISRALGNIEGWLRAMSSRRTTSGEFQGPKPPR